MTTWTIKYETMSGAKRVAKIKAKSASEAVTILCGEVRVGNVLGWK